MKFRKEAERLYSKLMIEEKDGDKIFYKKRRVYPVINQDGSVNWFNFFTGGSWKKLLFTVLILGIIIGFIFEYAINLKECSEVMTEYNLQKNLSFFYFPNLNLTGINYSVGNISENGK